MKYILVYWKQLFLLQKRLYKKKTFLALCLLLPLLAVGMKFVSEQKSGILHILLYEQEPSDALTGQIIDELLQLDSVIWFERVKDLNVAYEQVQAGKADAIWIFSDMQEKIEAVFQNKTQKKEVVKIVEQTDTVLLHLAREKLYGVLYPYLSYELFRQFIVHNFEMKSMPEEEMLRSYYEKVTIEGNLFRVAYADYEQPLTQESSYFVMPIRGILAVFIFVCGVACAMYVQQDRERGIFLHMSGWHTFWLELGSYVMTTWTVGICAIGVFQMVGIFISWKQEVTAMLLYGIMIAGLCYLLRRCFKTTTALGISLPIFVVLLLLCSPVFLHINEFNILQTILPVSNYLAVVYEPDRFISVLVYTACVWGLAVVVQQTITE